MAQKDATLKSRLQSMSRETLEEYLAVAQRLADLQQSEESQQNFLKFVEPYEVRICQLSGSGVPSGAKPEVEDNPNNAHRRASDELWPQNAELDRFCRIQKNLPEDCSRS